MPLGYLLPIRWINSEHAVEFNTVATCCIHDLSIHFLGKNYQVVSCWNGRSGLVHRTFFIRQLMCWDHLGSFNVSRLVKESRSNTRLSLNLGRFFFFFFFLWFHFVYVYLHVNSIIQQDVLELVVKLINLMLQLFILNFCSLHLSYQICILSLQVSYLLLEVMEF